MSTPWTFLIAGYIDKFCAQNAPESLKENVKI